MYVYLLYAHCQNSAVCSRNTGMGSIHIQGQNGAVCSRKTGICGFKLIMYMKWRARPVSANWSPNKSWKDMTDSCNDKFCYGTSYIQTKDNRAQSHSMLTFADYPCGEEGSYNESSSGPEMVPEVIF